MAGLLLQRSAQEHTMLREELKLTSRVLVILLNTTEGGVAGRTLYLDLASGYAPTPWEIAMLHPSILIFSGTNSRNSIGRIFRRVDSSCCVKAAV